MNKKNTITNTIKYVKKVLENAEGGHDWFHIERVYKNALLLSKTETVDIFIVSLAALLHDIADSKFHNGDDTIGPRKARNFLNSEKVNTDTIDHVVEIVENMSFNKSLDGKTLFNSRELQVVQDADRLDAIGAIGIARAFNYGGFKNRELYNPKILPNTEMSSDQYKKSTAPTINHFYEKLLLLKDKMNTESGKKIAQKRHDYMFGFLKQFYGEWNGKK